MYAANIDNIKMLEPALDVIAKTHVRAGIKPKHYPMLGIVLMQAIADVMEDVATPEYIDAWREAYKYLAEILIEKERRLYEQMQEGKE